MNTFGSRLKEARKAKGFTQKQLADAIGAKHNSVSNWENDQNKPDPDTIELICGVLDIEPNYLLIKSDSEKFSEYTRGLNTIHSPLMVNNIERAIVYNYRRADSIDKAIVRRTLHIDEGTNSSDTDTSQKKSKKYIPTEEDIKSLVARNGKNMTREEKIEFISALLSDEEDEEE
jgi:transcriptional regulator with XRE-family HTH domain